MRKVRVVPLLLVALVTVATLSVAGCGGTPETTAAPSAAPSSATSSGIIGLMTWEGGALATSPHPVSGVRIEVHRGGETGHVVETVQSGADGTFTVGLPPGHYTVVPVARGDETVMPASVTVGPGKWAHVSVGFSVR
jgi:hypothetical protein